MRLQDNKICKKLACNVSTEERKYFTGTINHLVSTFNEIRLDKPIHAAAYVSIHVLV
jgi:hypothetical protein